MEFNRKALASYCLLKPNISRRRCCWSRPSLVIFLAGVDRMLFRFRRLYGGGPTHSPNSLIFSNVSNRSPCLTTNLASRTAEDGFNLRSNHIIPRNIHNLYVRTFSSLGRRITIKSCSNLLYAGTPYFRAGNTQSGGASSIAR